MFSAFGHLFKVSGKKDLVSIVPPIADTAVILCAVYDLLSQYSPYVNINFYLKKNLKANLRKQLHRV